MEILNRPSHRAVFAVLFVLSALLITSRDVAASSAPTPAASAAYAAIAGTAHFTLAGATPTPVIQSLARSVAQDHGNPLTIDDCYTMMATLSLTGTPTLVTTEDDTGAPIVTCGGILTVAPTQAAPAALITGSAAAEERGAVTDSAVPTTTAQVTASAQVTAAAQVTASAQITSAPGPYSSTAPTVATIPGHGVPGQSWRTINPGYKQPTNLPVRGFSTYYNPGVMEQVVSYRTRVGDITPCPECIGEVALVRAGDINRRIWLQLDDKTVEGPFLVTDCAHTWDVGPLVRRGWGVDLDYDTAARWGFDMRVVTILDAPPAAWTQDPAIALATGAIMPAAPAPTLAAATTTTARLAMRPPTP